jgi:hypothetical protein
MATRSICDGIISTFGAEHFMIASLGCCCAPEFGMFQFQYYTSIPNPELALACGSASISTFFSKTPKEAAGLRMLLFFQLLLLMQLQ